MAGVDAELWRFGLLSILWRYEAILDSATIICTRRDADARRASDEPRARVDVAGLVGSFVLRLRAG